MRKINREQKKSGKRDDLHEEKENLRIRKSGSLGLKIDLSPADVVKGFHLGNGGKKPRTRSRGWQEKTETKKEVRERIILVGEITQDINQVQFDRNKKAVIPPLGKEQRQQRGITGSIGGKEKKEKKRTGKKDCHVGGRRSSHHQRRYF